MKCLQSRAEELLGLGALVRHEDKTDLGEFKISDNFLWVRAPIASGERLTSVALAWLVWEPGLEEYLYSLGVEHRVSWEA